MKFAGPTRKEIGIRTIFNLLGPISNPANPSVQLLGVPRPELTSVIATALKNLGAKNALVVHGLDGKDEISITGKTLIAELKDAKLRSYYITPQKHGLKRCSIE
ncbi:MAG: anthranilate phosphoribosyltransferase, partial [Candidatus Omnitrophota bacterium]